MSKDTNIIGLPVRHARPTRQAAPAAEIDSAVIDLVARKRATASRSEALPAGNPTDRLSPGQVWEALNTDRLVVHYQPQYDMQTRKTVAAEALVRLIGTNGQLIYPDRFIDPVEQRDLIVPLGRAVIEQVCLDLAACREQGLPIRRIAVNLSAHQLVADSGLLTFTDRTVARHGLRYDDLEFELTERHGLTPDCEGYAVLDALAERGARIVIDDFGVGYSSVIYLAELPVSAFKLDRSLVARVLEEKPAQALIEGLLGLARNMGLDVVAEGVETDAQGDYLAAAGCPLAQGFGYARPMQVEDLKALVLEENTRTKYSSIGV